MQYVQEGTKSVHWGINGLNITIGALEGAIDVIKYPLFFFFN